MSNDEEHFLKRWSRRKVEARQPPQAKPPLPAQEPASGSVDGAVSVEGSGEAASDQDPTASVRQPARVFTEDDFADVDFEKLDFNSDYARFMQKGVPESIRQKALRQLWSSDPVFSAVEQFNEYGGDFTDAAVAVAPGTLQTAWRFGKGLLSDEEAAEWEALGKPVGEREEKPTAPSSADVAEASQVPTPEAAATDTDTTPPAATAESSPGEPRESEPLEAPPAPGEAQGKPPTQA